MSGCTFTSTTDAAIVVNPTDVFHDQKCIASRTPPQIAIAHERASRTRHCLQEPRAISGIAIIPSEKINRQIAMAIGCASERRTSGPESETPRTDSNKTNETSAGRTGMPVRILSPSLSP